MGKKREPKRFTIQEVRQQINYQLSHTEIYKLANVTPYTKTPILVEGIDWITTKFDNIFYFQSAINKLKKHLSEKE